MGSVSQLPGKLDAQKRQKSPLPQHGLLPSFFGKNGQWYSPPKPFLCWFSLFGVFFVLFRGFLVFWKKKKNQSNKLLLRKISMRLKTLPPRAVRRMSCWHPLLYTLVLSCTFFHSAASNSISWQATSLVPYFVWLRELNFLFCCLDFFYCTEAKSSSSVLLPLSKLKQLTNI